MRHRGRVGVARKRARFATDHTSQRGAEGVPAGHCGLTSGAFVFKCGLTGYRIPGGVRGTYGEKQNKGNDEAGTHSVLQFLLVETQRSIAFRCAPPIMLVCKTQLKQAPIPEYIGLDL